MPQAVPTLPAGAANRLWTILPAASRTAPQPLSPTGPRGERRGPGEDPTLLAASTAGFRAAASVGSITIDPPQTARAAEHARLGLSPTPEATPVGGSLPWEPGARPRRPPAPPDATYTEQGRQIAQHLIDVHDGLRRELDELLELAAQVRGGTLGAGDARAALNAMAMRQNDWTLGAFCSRYCRVLAQHHGLEDGSIFPHLGRSDAALEPVLDQLEREHHAIHDAIEAVDLGLVHLINNRGDFGRLQDALDLLTAALLSHLSYEEQELVEPLARHGFYPGQVAQASSDAGP